ncbi:MAG: NAD(P)-dependent oxidoreductase [Deltaproteobacteria bacterium]|nr:NAD(P)-dependent oxidoreductase [Deltaproteobacteria bacterium]
MRIGWIGTGVMGRSMAGHVQAAGHEFYVHNRTKAKAEDLLRKGATWCDSPAEAAAKSEMLFSIVGLPSDVEETYLGKNGVLSTGGSCRIIVDMTTSRPSLAQIIDQEAAKRGVESLDAPVSGGDIGARDATLAIMVGGKKEIFDKVLPVFQLMGKNIAYMGGAGAGQHTKMSNQILVAGTMIGVCESLLYAVKLGLDQQAVIDIISKGAAGSWSISNLGPRLVRGDFKTGFLVRHFIKDMGIALQEAAAAGLSLPGLALVHQLYVAVMAQGHGDCTTQALYLALKSLNGMK